MSGTRCVVLMAAALALGACRKGATDADEQKLPGPVATVAVTPSAPSLPAGGTLQLQAVLKDAKGNTLSDRVVTWTSADTTIGKVSSTGLLSGTGVGQTTITAVSEGKTGAAAATVTIAPPQVSLDSAYYVSADSAYLWGYVNGWGAAYQLLFHLATNPGFSPADSSGSANGSASSGWGLTFSNLRGGTTYYYRIVARNSAGTTTSPARSFTTRPPGPPRLDSMRIDSIGPGNVRYIVYGGANGASTKVDFQDGSSSTSFTDIGAGPPDTGAAPRTGTAPS